MTREELEQIRTTTLHMAETPQRATLKSYVFRLVEALEAAWKRIDEVERQNVDFIVDRDDARNDVKTLRRQLEYVTQERDDALAECTRKTLLIAAITHDRDAYKFAAEQAIGMGTAKAIMDERDQLKHRVRELEERFNLAH